MKILMVHDNYNWDSYSIVRSACDILKEREDVEYIEIGSPKAEGMGKGDYAFIYSSRFVLLNIEYEALKEKGVTVVTFGLSDPNMFSEERLTYCDLYCTNDLNIYREYKDKYNVYHFQPGVDLTRFKKIDAPKDIDVLFIGTLKHSYIPYRKTYLLQLKKDIEGFRGFGEGWDRFLKGEELVLGYNRAYLNIDISTKVSSLSNARILQAAACGTPTLTLKREDVLQCFKDGKEILTYGGGYDELLRAVRAVMKGKTRLAEIGEAARQRCLKDHDMRKRVNDLIKYLEGNK